MYALRLLNLTLILVAFAACSTINKPHRVAVCGDPAQSNGCLSPSVQAHPFRVQVVDALDGSSELLDQYTCREEMVREMAWWPNPCEELPSVPRHAQPPNTRKQSYVPYRIAVIELDDYGDMWIEEQVDQAIAMLRSLSDRQILFLTYIHGWHHDAAENDNNLRTFGELVHALSGDSLCTYLSGDTPERTAKANVYISDRSDCAVFGLYFSWRGRSVSPKWLDFTTFYGRYNAARRSSDVVSTSILSTFTSVLAAQDKARVERLRIKNHVTIDADYPAFLSSHSSRSILLGHSFGARFLESALAQTTIGRREALDRSNMPSRLHSLGASIDSSIVGINTLKSSIEEFLKSVQDLETESEILASQANRLTSSQLIGTAAEAFSEEFRSTIESSPYSGRTRGERIDESQWKPLRVRTEGHLMADELISAATKCQSEGGGDYDRELIEKLVEQSKNLSSLAEQIHTNFSPKIADFDWRAAMSAACENEESVSRTFLALGGEDSSLDAALERIREIEKIVHRLNAGQAKNFVYSCGDLQSAIEWYSGATGGLHPNAFDHFTAPAELRAQISSWKSRLTYNVRALCRGAVVMDEIREAQNSILTNIQERREIGKIILGLTKELAASFSTQIKSHQTSVGDALLDSIELLRSQADLVVMINPATEGIRGEQLAVSLQNFKNDQNENLFGDGFRGEPALIQVAGWEDFMTNRLFGLALGSKALLGRNAPARTVFRSEAVSDRTPTGTNQVLLRRESRLDYGSQSELIRVPLPQLSTAVTHCVFANPSIEEVSSSTSEKPRMDGIAFARGFEHALKSGNDSNSEESSIRMIPVRLGLPRDIRTSVDRMCSNVEKLQGSDVEAKVEGTLYSDTYPIWVVAGGKDFINGHNDIFNLRVGEFIGLALRRSSMMNFSCGTQNGEDSRVCNVVRKLGRLQLKIAELDHEIDRLERKVGSSATVRSK